MAERQQTTPLVSEKPWFLPVWPRSLGGRAVFVRALLTGLESWTANLNKNGNEMRADRSTLGMRLSPDPVEDRGFWAALILTHGN